MFFHDNTRYALYFGNADDALFLTDETRTTIAVNPFQIPLFAKLQEKMSLSDITFLHQTHGMQGLIITNKETLPINSFSLDGDYIITNLLHTGIGIFTADCLPIVVYDSMHHIATVIHAGWKGAVAGIVPTVIRALQEQFQTNLGHLTILFGPSAKQCCYEVQPDFIPLLNPYTFSHKTLHYANNRPFFDLPLFVQLQLTQQGVPIQAIDTTHNDCTICNLQFFSHRRQQKDAGRNVTLIALK